MLLREFHTASYILFIAKVRVVQPNYSQWIDVQIPAKSMQEAKNLLLAQYGPNAKITGLRKKS
jgi:hypothetical protein